MDGFFMALINSNTLSGRNKTSTSIDFLQADQHKGFYSLKRQSQEF